MMPFNSDLGRVVSSGKTIGLCDRVDVGSNPSSVTCGFEQMAEPVSSSHYFTIWLKKLNETTYIELLA